MKKVLLIMLALVLICTASEAAKEATKMSRDDTATPVYQFEDVNAGDAFLFSAVSVDLADDASLTGLITISTNNVYITPIVSSSGAGIAYVYEKPTVVTIGTDFAPVQLNRPLSVSNTTSITGSYNASCSSYGTILDQAAVTSGVTTMEKFRALASTQYLIRVENEAGAAAQVGVKAKIDEY